MSNSFISFLFMALIFFVGSIVMNYLFYWRKNAPFKMPETVEKHKSRLARYDPTSFSNSTTNLSHDYDR